MILGILSLVSCLAPLGIPAVIFGHVGRSRVRKSVGTITGGGMAIAGLVTGYIGTLMTLGFAGLMIYGMLEDTKVTGKPEDLFPLPESGRITLPDLVGGELMEGTRVKIYEASASGGAPGGGTRFRILVPVGEHAAGALPCVLVAPAGSDLLSGMDLDEGDYFDETLPYAEARYAFGGDLNDAAPVSLVVFQDSIGSNYWWGPATTKKTMYEISQASTGDDVYVVGILATNSYYWSK